MNGSIYDNVPHGIKQVAALQVSLLGNANASTVSAATPSVELSRNDSNGLCYINSN